ncbi:unnamed protein product [Adineta steineri]|uniref:Sushi domain-containing protein n=1 Tax=Adineta steineri TaxID=433720 RepID=A0A814QNY1_9BILA|nr:unnamed protein product [Adineta steineri]
MKLSATPQDTTVVFVDSYAVVACATGYTNTGGSLNVTCLSTGSWSAFPNCVINGGSGSLTTTTIATGIGATTTTTISAGNGGVTTTTTAPGNPALTTTTTPSSGGAACPYDPTTLFALTNGFYISSSISNPTPTTANGWIQFTCNPGYALDPTVGASYTCNNGVWSTKPRCLITPRCSMDTLNKFLSSSTAIQTTSQMKLSATPQDTTVVFVDSYAVVACATGYTNTGGSLNVTCLSTGSWSAFPNCVINGGSGSLTTTTISAGNGGITTTTTAPGSPALTTTTTPSSGGAACPYDPTTLFALTNGYYISSSISNPTPTTATGWIQFTCNPGYALDPTVGASYTCNNGVWSTKPRCLITPRCSMDTLNKFLSSPTIQTTTQIQLRASPQDTTVVFVDSYAVVACAAGYMNTGGNLNVTCLSTGSWSPFPNCVINGGSGSLTTTTISAGNGGITTTTTAPGNPALTTTTTPSSGGAACPYDPTTIFALTNGYYTSSSISNPTPTTAAGWIQFTCNPGYALDPTVGASYTCNNGIWSTKPRCLITPRCSMDTLNKFLSSPTIQTTTQIQLRASPQDTTVVFVDSYIVVSCAVGYTNTGGSLNITCLSTGAWSAFPNCVLTDVIPQQSYNSGGSATTIMTSTTNGPVITTTTSVANGLACMIDAATFTITSGYYLTSSLSNPSPGTATGWIQFTCNPGYALDPTVGASYTCNNGVWSTKPRCLITPRCSMDTLNKFLSSPTIQTTNQTQLRASPQDQTIVFVDSYIVVTCAAGYMNTGGSLNVTCLSTGSWSPFPTCVINGGSGSLTTTTISTGNSAATTTTTTPSSGGTACPVDLLSIFILTNGYYTINGLSFKSITSATGSVQFACNPGYVLDPTVGASYTCNNGVWSTKPRCLITARCSMDTLNKFLSLSPAVQVTDQRQLRATTLEPTAIFSDSYMVVICAASYMNTGGSLNITCLSTGSWSPFPNCVINGGSGSLTTTTISTGNSAIPTTTTPNSAGAACPYDPTTLFTLTNGYYISSSISNPTPTTAAGWVQFTCNPGYALDPTVGAQYTCNNGVWSSKPRCLITTHCSYSALTKFLSTASNTQPTTQYRIMMAQQDPDAVLIDSYMIFICTNGYTNNGGSLNVTCLPNGSWTSFPLCVINNGGGPVTTTAVTTTTTKSTSNGLSCPIDGTTTSVVNGYPTSSSLTYASTNAVTGSIQFTCSVGYALDPTIGASYTCNNGIWSTKPRCLTTSRCSYAVLKTFLSTPSNTQPTSQYRIMMAEQDPDAVLIDSYMLFVCPGGYTNTGGNLNVTCLANGLWTSFPLCVNNNGAGPVTTTTTATTTTKSTSNSLSCSIDGTTTSIANGYPTSSSLTYTSTNAVTGSIQFTCSVGYALDPTIGASYICNNGIWSTKPRCLTTSRCSYAVLKSFLSTPSNTQPTSQYRIMMAQQDADAVLVDSYIVFVCPVGYANTGGNLNVTCLANGLWTSFPLCINNNGGSPVTTTSTTTKSTINGLPCPVDGTTTGIVNGYLTSSSLSYTSITAVTGSVQFTCFVGYALDPTIGASYTCNNGVWSRKPQCLMTGRCSYSALKTFVSTANNLQGTSQYHLVTAQQDSDAILADSYIVFVCASGYTNTGGNFNVTCLPNGLWTSFPLCVNNNGGSPVTTTTTTTATTTTTKSTSNGSPCLVETGTTSIVNGYSITSSLSYASATAATGSIQFTCSSGYALDPTIGGLYTCNNGIWSTKPRCLTTSRCSYAILTRLLATVSNLQATSQYHITTAQQDPDAVLTDSYIVFVCTSGYTNTGGSLNVTCLPNGSWSSAPICVLNNGGSPATTTTKATGNGSPCPIDGTTTSIVNGYSTSSSLSYASSTAATGSIQFTCLSGYILDSTIGSSYTCINGVWSAKPRCVVPGRCSYMVFNNFIRTANTLKTTDQFNLVAVSQDTNTLLTNSYFVLTCITGYVNIGGSLNVTCLMDGSWSPFPNCVLNTQSRADSWSGSKPCHYESSMLNLTNGYADFYNGIMSPTDSQAESGAYINYICMSSYTLIGNSRITCINGSWSAQPTCIASNQSSTTTKESSADCAKVPSIKNGNVSSTTYSRHNNTIYSSKVEYVCMAGYTHLNTSGQLSVSCINGVWDPLPVCAVNPTCAFKQLISTLMNVKVISKSFYFGSDDIPIDNWIKVQCNDGLHYNSSSGPLNITCLATGSWTPFPICS